MPELPEVECIVRDLRRYCVEKKITRVKFLFSGMLRGITFTDFIKRVVGQTIRDVKRRGKYILIYLSNTEVIEIHLRMTGQLLFYNTPVDPDKYTRAIFYLNGFSRLLFQDVRKFGTFRLWKKNELSQSPSFLLGSDPFDEKFDFVTFQTLLNRNPARIIKSFLLDQRIIAGMGNIYTDEALFGAGIHPARKTGSLSFFEQEQLYHSVCNILQKAISLKGTSFSDYRDLAGEKGGYQEMLKVYRRKGEPCFRCGTEIQRHVIANRGTYICGFCQPWPNEQNS